MTMFPQPSAPARTTDAATLLVETALELFDAMEAVAQIDQTCATLLRATAAGDTNRATAAAGALLCVPSDETAYPGVNALMFRAVDALEARWPEGTHPQPADLYDTVVNHGGALAGELLAVAAIEAVNVGDWGTDGQMLLGWATTCKVPNVPGAHLGHHPDATARVLLALATRHGVPLLQVLLELATVIATIDPAGHAADHRPWRS